MGKPSLARASTTSARNPSRLGIGLLGPTHSPSLQHRPRCSMKWPWSSGEIVPIGSSARMVIVASGIVNPEDRALAATGLRIDDTESCMRIRVQRRSVVVAEARKRQAPVEVEKAVRVVNFRALVFWALAVYLIYHLIDLIAFTVLLFALAFFFAIVLDPPIRKLDRRGLSRGWSVAIIALGFLAAVGLAVYLAVPPIVRSEERRVGKECRSWWSP